MPPAPGTHLGPYRVVSKIEAWLARIHADVARMRDRGKAEQALRDLL